MDEVDEFHHPQKGVIKVFMKDIIVRHVFINQVQEFNFSNRHTMFIMVRLINAHNVIIRFIKSLL